MIIDFHTHAFPERIARHALDSLTTVGGGIRPLTDGTAEGLRAMERDAGVDHCVVLGIATNPAQQRNVNDFAASINGGFFSAFGSVHPAAPDALDELDRIAVLGLKGIKFHPQYQDFYVDDESVVPIYEKAAALGLIAVFHAGADIGMSAPWRCTPSRLRRALPAFGGAPVVAAHLGGYLLWDDVERELVGQNVYLDTSICYSRAPVAQAREIVRAHGAERILFGSDLPWSAPADEMRYILHLGLSAPEEAQILGGNAAALLRLC